MKRKYLQSLFLCLITAVVVLTPSPVLAATYSDKPKAKAAPTQTCKQKIAKVNYRSSLLEIYKKSENGKHDALHKKWATRISYAGQWVPKDAEKARKSLYKYDALHAVTEKEINKQIQDYKYLKTSPLDCSKTKPAVLASKLEDVRGIKNKKVVGGQALIAQDKKAETQYLNNDFKKSTGSLVKNLHKAKTKHPKPEHSKTDVKAS